jgi:hypothetical protein
VRGRLISRREFAINWTGFRDAIISLRVACLIAAIIAPLAGQGELGTMITHRFNSWNNAVGFRGQLEAGDDPVQMVRQLQRKSYDLLLKKIFPAVLA